MSIEGWYYLHTNGDLIYKRELGGTAADIRESDCARCIWPHDPTNRKGAWDICVEALALGANKARVADLAQKWGLTDTDAGRYAKVIGIRIFMDGNAWCATKSDFKDLQESPSGFGESALESMSALAKEIGLRDGMIWRPTFADLVRISDEG